MTYTPTARTAGTLLRHRLPLLLATGLVGLTLAGCTSERVMVGAVPEDYRSNHPITVSESLATMDVPAGSDTPYLARGMDENVLAFAGSFLDSRSPEIAIVLPTGSANQAAAGSIAGQLESILVGAGVPTASITYRAYPANPGETQAPVRLAYVRVAANTEACGPWTDDVSDTNENRNYAAFGCATQQNLAAIVSNPLDLLYPRVMTSASSERRTTILTQYQEGQMHISEYQDFGKGLIQVVGN